MSARKMSLYQSVIAAMILLLSALPALAVKGINADGTLDKPTISKAYFEGEFWTVINALEAFRKSGRPATREDSIYTFKYLSVVYAAEPTTRVKAESYMYQLIRMMPTIDLLDLYISDNIQSIFVKVKSDFEKLESHKAAEAQPAAVAQPGAQAKPQTQSETAKAAAAAATPTSRPADPPKPAQAEARPQKKSRLKVWAPLALGGVGIATAAFLVASLADEPSPHNTPRPVDVTLEWPKEGSQ